MLSTYNIIFGGGIVKMGFEQQQSNRKPRDFGGKPQWSNQDHLFQCVYTVVVICSHCSLMPE